MQSGCIVDWRCQVIAPSFAVRYDIGWSAQSTDGETTIVPSRQPLWIIAFRFTDCWGMGLTRRSSQAILEGRRLRSQDARPGIEGLFCPSLSCVHSVRRMVQVSGPQTPAGEQFPGLPDRFNFREKSHAPAMAAAAICLSVYRHRQRDCYGGSSNVLRRSASPL